MLVDGIEGEGKPDAAEVPLHSEAPLSWCKHRAKFVVVRCASGGKGRTKYFSPTATWIKGQSNGVHWSGAGLERGG